MLGRGRKGSAEMAGPARGRSGGKAGARGQRTSERCNSQIRPLANGDHPESQCCAETFSGLQWLLLPETGRVGMSTSDSDSERVAVLDLGGGNLFKQGAGGLDWENWGERLRAKGHNTPPRSKGRSTQLGMGGGGCGL